MADGLQPRQKKLIGLAILGPALILYIGVAAWLGAKLPQNTLLQLPFFLVAGVLWALPARYLVKWMVRPAAESDASPTSQQ